MKTVIRHARLPFTFDADALRKDLEGITSQWVLHFNQANYEGEWSALPLRSKGGSLTNVIPANGSTEAFEDTELMAQCPYIKHVLTQFSCTHNSVRLLKLKPGAVVKEHFDQELSFEDGEARIHVPVITNAEVEFYIDQERVAMAPGSCWYMNFALPHRINNFGTTDRVHLVIDVEINDAMRQLFAGLDPALVQYSTINNDRSAADKQAIIEQLKAMNTPTALELATQLEQELTPM